MPTKIDVPDFTFVYQDIFVFKSLYKLAKEWLEEQGFRDQYGGFEFMEKKYVHKEMPGGMHEINIVWEVERKYTNKNIFFKMQIEFLLIAGKIEERIIDGKKVKGDTGELDVFVRPSMFIKDDDWDKNVFLKKVKDRTFRKNYKEEVETAKAWIYKRAKNFVGLLKDFLETKAAFKPQDEMFHSKWDKW